MGHTRMFHPPIRHSLMFCPPMQNSMKFPPPMWHIIKSPTPMGHSMTFPPPIGNTMMLPPPKGNIWCGGHDLGPRSSKDISHVVGIQHLRLALYFTRDRFIRGASAGVRAAVRVWWIWKRARKVFHFGNVLLIIENSLFIYLRPLHCIIAARWQH